MASSTATGATISLPSFASSFEMTQQRTSPRARSTHSSRSNSREPRPRHYRPYPESNTRGAPRDERSRKRPAPIDEADGDGDVGMQSDPEQDGDDESSGSSAAPVKEEQVSDVEQSPSPPPTPNAGARARYAHALPQPAAQSHFAPTPPASAHRVSPPHITLPTLPQQRDPHLTLPPMLHPPPEPQPPPYQSYHGEPIRAGKRRRVTISGVAAGSQAAARPLHRTVLERANSGYQAHNPPPPGSSATPATPTAMSGMVSPVVTPGFNMNSPGAIAQVRDTIAIRMEQKALIEQRKNGGAASVSVTTPHARTGPQPPAPLGRTQSSPAGQTAPLPPPTTSSPLQNTITPPTLPPPTPTALTGPPPPTQTLAHRRGKASNKLTIHTPNSSISSVQGLNPTGLGLSTGTNPPAGLPAPGARLGLPDIGAAIRSAPPNITKFNPAHIQRPQPAAPPAPPPQPQRTTQVPTPLKERSVSIRRLHASSTAGQNAPPAPLAIVAPGQPLTLNAPAPPSSYIATPTRTQFPPHTPHPQPPRTARPPTSPPISRNAFMAFYDAYAEVHTLRAQVERMEREMDRRVEVAVREMREEIRMLREEMRRGRERDAGYTRDAGYPPYEREPGYAREREPAYPREREPAYGRERDASYTRERGDSTYARDWDRRRGGSTSVNQSPMQVDKRPLPDKMHVDKPIERPVLPGPGDRLPPPPGERIPGPGERVVGPGDRIIAPGDRIPSGPSGEKLHAHGPAPVRSAMRKSPSGRGLASSLSPPSRAPSVGATGGTPGPGIGNGAGPGAETGARTRAKARVRTNSPGGGASGDKSGSG